jgi:hypothetical protein
MEFAGLVYLPYSRQKYIEDPSLNGKTLEGAYEFLQYKIMTTKFVHSGVVCLGFFPQLLSGDETRHFRLTA